MLENKEILDELDLFTEGGGDFVNSAVRKPMSRVFNASNHRLSHTRFFS